MTTTKTPPSLEDARQLIVYALNFLGYIPPNQKLELSEFLYALYESGFTIVPTSFEHDLPKFALQIIDNPTDTEFNPSYEIVV